MNQKTRTIDQKISDNYKQAINSTEKDKLKTRELAEELEKKGIGSFEYIKSRLHTKREWLADKNHITTYREEDETGGEPTRYWKVKQE